MEPNRADNVFRGVAALVALGVVAAVAWWAGSASAKPKAWVEISQGTSLSSGTLYRASIPPVSGATSDSGASGFDAVSSYVTILDPPPPSDWPSSDLDPTRWRYQFIANEDVVLTDWPTGMRLFAWE